MGKQSRRKRERRHDPIQQFKETIGFKESAAGRQFRDEIGLQAVDEMFREWPDVDWPAVMELTNGWTVLYGQTPDEPRITPLLHPKIADQMEFDRRVCATGLTDYFRDTMPEDNGKNCTPLDSRTGKPDPSIERTPEMMFGKHLRVVQVAPGVRIKKEWRIAIFTGPDAGYVSPPNPA